MVCASIFEYYLILNLDYCLTILVTLSIVSIVYICIKYEINLQSSFMSLKNLERYLHFLF